MPQKRLAHFAPLAKSPSNVMVNSRKIDELMKDLGLDKQQKEHLKDAVNIYLVEVAGSIEAVSRIKSSAIRRHCEGFLNTEAGRQWFESGESSTDWHYHVSRGEVLNALCDLMGRWIKQKKNQAKKGDAGHSLGEHGAASTAKASVGLAQSPTTPRRLSGFFAVNSTRRAEPRDHPVDVVDFSEGETDPSPDKPVDDNSEGEETSDIAAIFEPGASVQGPVMTIDTNGTVRIPQHESREVSARAESERTEVPSPRPTPSKTPARETHSALGRSSKRRWESIEGEETALPNETSQWEPATRKRARTAASATPTPTEQTTFEETQPDEIPTAADSNRATGSPAASRGRASELSESKAAAFPTYHVIATRLSNKSARQINLGLDALIDIPATMLDYIEECRLTSLAKAMARGVTEAESRRYRDRSKLFRDIFLDIESRISSLEHQAIQADEGRSDGQAKVKVDMEAARNSCLHSSYCLWE